MFRPSASGSTSKRVRTTTTVVKAKPKAKPKSRVPRQLAIINLGKGFPVKAKMTHRYCDTQRITMTSGIPSFIKIVANGMYDPDNTSVGHQPYYFDQMSAIYNHYTVISSYITCTFLPVLSSTPALICSLATNDDGTIGNSSAIWKQIEQTGTRYTTTCAGQSDAKILRHYYNAEEVFGGDPLANDDLQGTITSNPVEQYYWIIATQPLDMSSTCQCEVVFDIQYTCVWDELKDVPNS